MDDRETDGTGRRPGRLGARRRSREPGNPRTIRHVVRVDQATEKQLVERAAEGGFLNVVDLMVESALAGGADSAQAAHELAGELYRVTRFLGKVGVNINQIARATNATLETQPETVAAMEAVERAIARLEDLLSELGARA